ncbi:hypothetical protein B0H14DRAFT_3711197 [Mycena olivaceomarginata]|nr:hypothetical protein B0H14DRAFT_3711197 [Mycena olivaceomarginata]
MDFMYIDSAEKLTEFDNFVRSLGVKKVQDWWDHKAMSPWILPCLIKSQSPMSPEDWDNTPSTTNTGEAQHHWTNHQIGVKKSLVENPPTHCPQTRFIPWPRLQRPLLYATMGDVFDPDSAGTYFPAVSAPAHHLFPELDDILYLPAASKIDDMSFLDDFGSIFGTSVASPPPTYPDFVLSSPRTPRCPSGCQTVIEEAQKRY